MRLTIFLLLDSCVCTSEVARDAPQGIASGLAMPHRAMSVCCDMFHERIVLSFPTDDHSGGTVVMRYQAEKIGSQEEPFRLMYVDCAGVDALRAVPEEVPPTRPS